MDRIELLLLNLQRELATDDYEWLQEKKGIKGSKLVHKDDDQGLGHLLQRKFSKDDNGGSKKMRVQKALKSLALAAVIRRRTESQSSEVYTWECPVDHSLTPRYLAILGVKSPHDIMHGRLERVLGWSRRCGRCLWLWKWLGWLILWRMLPTWPYRSPDSLPFQSLKGTYISTSLTV
ncbi:hypothetical protein PIB30_072372 [Stylosanthes scabra]|uniref:Uncharacterized protein n=1 Tax=Stylosanthes scabra TaxID=79078 RepID=A0ABU6QNT4_9FABA|nr:hypothetical protein [Stylosanthes scabra]